MKKLMIAAAIVCAAAYAQAASALTWNTSGSFYNIVGEEGSWNYVAEGTTAYFLFVNDYSQDQLVSDFRSEDGINMTKFGANKTGTIGSDGAVVTVAGSSTDYTGLQYGYIALIEDGNLFISDAVQKEINILSGTTYTFEEAETGDIWANWGDAATYQGAGWYQAVPEPTTGLLMLIGMGALALRRRRA